MVDAATFDQSPAIVALKQHYDAVTSKTHLKQLLQDEERNAALRFKLLDKIWLDYTHTKIDAEGLRLLGEVARERAVAQGVKDMFAGEVCNPTEGRQVWHVKLRTQEEAAQVDQDVRAVQTAIKQFAEKIRSGASKGYTGKPIMSVVAIGIGGSYLGPEFVYEALRFDETARTEAHQRKLKFLANVDPVDISRALSDVDLEETLVVIVSKTFTTAETMLNARTIKRHLVDFFTSKVENANAEEALKAHLCAVSTNHAATDAYGIARENVFGFWDWVGGRFSVSSAVGLLPLSLHYGFEVMDAFLKGLASVDAALTGSLEAPLEQSPVAMMGLIGFYNTYIAGIESRAVLPYSQALLRFPAHIQQLDMESNGKTCAKNGTRLADGVHTGPIILGEPGTNGQHSFYQLMHQGRPIAAEFIGFTEAQTPMDDASEAVSNHDELMSNFFAQPDALALGKSMEELEASGVPEHLRTHKLFPGDRPSLSILFAGALTATNCGQLLALYEHRVAVEGFLYGINSFDQWGVELGKVLAKDVRAVFAAKKKGADADVARFNPATQHLLAAYLASK